MLLKYSEVVSTLFEEPQPVVPGWINEGEVAMLVAYQKSGKTLLALQWALQTQQPVLYVALEGTPQQFRDYLTRYAAAGIKNESVSFLFQSSLLLEHPDTFLKFRSYCRRVRPKLIVIDPLYRVVPALRDDRAVIHVTARLNEIVEEIECGLLVLHHKHRPRTDVFGVQIDEGVEAYYGSFAIAAWVHSLYIMEFDAKTKRGSLSVGFERIPKAKDADLFLEDQGVLRWRVEVRD